MKKMTKRQVLDLFRKFIKPSIPKGDKIMLREAWNNFTDGLNKDGSISDKQVYNWTNPF